MMRRLAVLVTCLSAPLAPAAAQDADFHDPADAPALTVGAALIEREGPGTWVLASVRGTVPVSPTLAVTADLPLVLGHGGTLAGNPFVGIITAGGAGEFSGRIGVRLPVASGDEPLGLIGALADFERFEAYLADVLSVSGSLQYMQPTSSAFVFRARLEPTVTYIVRSGLSSDRSDFLLDYGAQFGYDGDATAVSAAVTGRASVSGGGADIGARTTHQLTLAGSHDFGQLRPGLFVRLPLDAQLSGSFGYVLGVTLRLEL